MLLENLKNAGIKKAEEEMQMNPVVVRNVKIGEGIPKICVPIVGITKEEIPVDVAE